MSRESTRRWARAARVASALAVTTSVMVACGGTERTPSSAPTKAGAPDGEAPGAPREASSACDLLSVEEIERATGRRVTPHDRSICFWEDSEGEIGASLALALAPAEKAGEVCSANHSGFRKAWRSATVEEMEGLGTSALVAERASVVDNQSGILVCFEHGAISLDLVGDPGVRDLAALRQAKVELMRAVLSRRPESLL